MKSFRLVALMSFALGVALMWSAGAVSAAVHTVNPGDSIQAAIDAAAPGDTVKVMPGDYTGVPAGSSAAAIRITKKLKLIAKSKIKKDVRVRILPGVGQTHGILIEPATPGDPDVEGVLVKGFTVEGFQNNGIWLRHVNKFKIIGNESINNLENGIWPTLSGQRHGEEERLLRLPGQRAVGRGLRERPGDQERPAPQPDGPGSHRLPEHQDPEEHHP
jgi:nitrous oxidase accessory protein NosD